MKETIKKINPKVLLGIGALVLGIAIIAICSFFPFIIDPTRWQTTEFLTDELILCAIVLFAMMAMFYVSCAMNAQDERSNIARAKVRFIESVKQITDRSAFFQWVKQVKQPADMKEMVIRDLRSVGLNDAKIMDLERSQLKELLEHSIVVNGYGFRQITKVQYKMVLDYLNGKRTFKFVEPDYYMSFKNQQSNKTTSEIVANESKSKIGTILLSTLVKLAFTLVPAMVFASLVYDVTSSQEISTALLKFFNRLFAFATSCFSGYLLGSKMNDIDAFYIRTRTGVHSEFLQDKTFKPKTEQELILEEVNEGKTKDIVESNI